MPIYAGLKSMATSETIIDHLSDPVTALMAGGIATGTLIYSLARKHYS